MKKIITNIVDWAVMGGIVAILIFLFTYSNAL